MASIKDRTQDGKYIVPDDQKMLIGAYDVWEGGLSNGARLGYAFPGNGLIAYNYLAAGDTVKAAPFAAYAAATSPIMASLSVGELFWESLDSSLNSGKSISEFLATNPGSQLVTYQGGKIQAIIGADGKTIGAFVDSQLDTLPLAGLARPRCSWCRQLDLR